MGLLPFGTCHTHIHIYDTTTPTAPTAMGPGPGWADVAAYRAIQARLGLTRTVTGGPDFADVATLGREAAARFPERIIWASNWPHIGIANPPDEAVLLDTLLGWAPPTARQMILVDTPAALYDFPAHA